MILGEIYFQYSERGSFTCLIGETSIDFLEILPVFIGTLFLCIVPYIKTAFWENVDASNELSSFTYYLHTKLTPEKQIHLFIIGVTVLITGILMEISVHLWNKYYPQGKVIEKDH